jgi:hypothetical protein
VDLSSLPEQAEYTRHAPSPLMSLCAFGKRVRPLVPSGAQLRPGTNFGPLVGTAMGTFSPLYLYFSDMPVVLREALENLRTEGSKACEPSPPSCASAPRKTLRS